MNLILSGIAIFFIILVGILPFRVIYILSDITSFFLHRVIGYRKKIIRGNLERCFPEKSKNEIDKLVSKSYKNLADVTIEGFKAFTMTRKQIVRRHKIINPEILDRFKGTNRNLIATPCHYGNWEWGALSPSLQLDYKIVGFYTPLSNPYINRYIKKNRSRTGTILASTRETTKTFDAMTDQRTVFIMAADQSPSKPDRAIWVDFLGQKTAFLNGPEKHARLRNIPVIFTDIQRVKRGYYKLELSFTADKPSETKEAEITEIYARKLEKNIRNKPENWLWSHKRWKLNKS